MLLCAPDERMRAVWSETGEVPRRQETPAIFTWPPWETRQMDRQAFSVSLPFLCWVAALEPLEFGSTPMQRTGRPGWETTVGDWGGMVGRGRGQQVRPSPGQ